MTSLVYLKKLKKLQKELDKAEGWDDRQIILRKSSSDIIRGIDPDAIIGLIDAAKELSDILNDRNARREVDSFTIQPLDLALLRLEKRK
jgi:hypothetical protein